MSDDSNDTAARRPFYLVIALVTLWLVGMNAAGDGFVVIEAVKNPFSTLFTIFGSQALEGVMRQATADAIAQTSRISLPLGVAQMMLGILLVAVSFKALFGRRASPSFALQVIVANAAIAVVGYALRQPVRARVVDAVAQSGVEERPPTISPVEFDRLVRTKWWWTYRIKLGLELAALTFGAIAITRRSARAVLARAEPSASEER